MAEVRLGPHPARGTTDRATQGLLDEAFRGRLDEPLAWSLRPMAHTALERRLPARLGRLREHGGSLATGLSATRGVRLVRRGRCLYAFDAPNLARTLDPVLAAGAGDGPVERVTARPSARRLARLTSDATGIAAAVVEAARAAGAPADDGAVLRYALTGARALARAEAALPRAGADLLVLATQHAPNMRALIAVARGLGLATMYLPHAPVAANRQYADLPTDHAALRGQGEVEVYTALGAVRPPGIGGNPSGPGIGITGELRLPPVLALSPNPEPVLAELVALVASVVGDDLVVAPHPSSDDAVLARVLPPQWAVWRDGPTYELLGRGPVAVLQHSSGVAWEALARGIPTIELAFDDDSPNYFLIREPAVRVASSSAELRAALGGAEADAADTSARQALVDWARHWCAITGDDAVARCREAVLEALELGPQAAPLVDGWRRGVEPPAWPSPPA